MFNVLTLTVILAVNEGGEAATRKWHRKALESLKTDSRTHRPPARRRLSDCEPSPVSRSPREALGRDILGWRALRPCPRQRVTNEAVDQLGVADPERLHDLRVHADVGEAGQGVHLVD
jgi:hypothetical protein